MLQNVGTVLYLLLLVSTHYSAFEQSHGTPVRSQKNMINIMIKICHLKTPSIVSDEKRDV
jgi:hypothetical protein